MNKSDVVTIAARMLLMFSQLGIEWLDHKQEDAALNDKISKILDERLKEIKKKES